MNNEYLKIISERLRSERLRLDLKQTDILKAVDVAISTFSNYETGKRAPDAEFLMKLGELGYDVGYVLTGERIRDGAVSLPPDEQEWLETYRNLKADDRDRLIKMAKSLLPDDSQPKVKYFTYTIPFRPINQEAFAKIFQNMIDNVQNRQNPSNKKPPVQ